MKGKMDDNIATMLAGSAIKTMKTEILSLEKFTLT